MEVITKTHPKIRQLLTALEGISGYFRNLAQNRRQPLNGEYFLTDKEVSEKLKISRRTLQDYRDQGKIAYVHLGGKILYKESDLQAMLESHYFKAWK